MSVVEIAAWIIIVKTVVGIIGIIIKVASEA